MDIELQTIANQLFGNTTGALIFSIITAIISVAAIARPFIPPKYADNVVVKALDYVAQNWGHAKNKDDKDAK